MRVKGFVSLLTAILIASALPQVAMAADLPSFEIKSVSSTMIDPGDTVTWKIQVNLIPGWVKDLNLFLVDPSGESRQLYTPVDSSYMVKEKNTVDISLSLKTNEYDLAGKYRIQWAYLSNTTEVFYYDPINGKEYAGKGGGNTFAQNFNEFDFTIRDSGSGKQKTPQLIQSIGFTKSQINPGASAKFELKTSGTGSLVNTYVTFSTPDGTMSSYCDATSIGNSYSCEGLSNFNGNYTFSIPVWTSDDNSPGVYKVTKVTLNYRNSNPTSANDTANWGGSIIYSDSETYDSGLKAEALSQFPQNALSFTLLDAGQGTAQTPIWTELAWKNKSVKAGSTATLVISADGFTRNIGSILVPIFVPQTGKVEYLYTNQNGATPIVRLIKPVQEKSKNAIVKNGTYEVDVYFPRNAKPGNYVIGQLSLVSTSCQLATMQEINSTSKVNNLGCQSWPNAWHTTYFIGSISKDFGASGYNKETWANYKDPQTFPIEVLAPEPLEAPKIEEINISPSVIEYRYLYSNEQSCVGSTSAGDLDDGKLIKDNYWTFKVNNLKPDSPVSITLTCTDATDAKATSALTSRTTKPIPPASPRLTLDSVTTDSASFSIGIREGFDYTVKSDSGKAEILGNKESGYKVEVSGLKPGVKTNLVATITDSYGQSTSSEPLYFAAELPPKPLKPTFTIGKATTNRVEFKYEKLDDLDYELTVSEGSVIDSNGSVTVRGLTPNTKITVVVKVTDQYGQSMVSEELIIKTAVPELRALPVLYLVKTGSNSISLRFTPSSGMKYIAKTSAGLANVSEGSIIISGLKPLQKVQVSLEMRDAYEQIKTSDFYTYTTGPAPKTPAKLTITCIKGKTSKLITAVNPKCPSGFKKK
jgi:hypothetical protein